MTAYSCDRVPGGTYLITVTPYDRRSKLLVERVDVLRSAVRKEQTGAPFHIDAWVVLPIICIVFGLCRKGMRIFQRDGKGVSGNTAFAMVAITPGMWIMCFSTR